MSPGTIMAIIGFVGFIIGLLYLIYGRTVSISIVIIMFGFTVMMTGLKLDGYLTVNKHPQSISPLPPGKYEIISRTIRSGDYCLLLADKKQSEKKETIILLTVPVSSVEIIQTANETDELVKKAKGKITLFLHEIPEINPASSKDKKRKKHKPS